MNNEFWTKTTHFKLFGKVFFTKEEICSDIEYQGQIYNIQVSQDYYKSEFDMNKKNEKNN